MNLWNWFLDDEKYWGKFGYGKRAAVGLVAFIFVPMALYILNDMFASPR